MTTWRPEVASEVERLCREHRWRVVSFNWPSQLISKCSACGAVEERMVEATTGRGNGTKRKRSTTTTTKPRRRRAAEDGHDKRGARK